MTRPTLIRSLVTTFFVAALILALGPAPARAAETLCDSSSQNCRTQLLTLIRNETVGIDVGFWFMEDQRYVSAIIARKQAGVRVRLLVDPRANPSYPLNQTSLDAFQQAGVRMRNRTASGILHWKMMLFAGQNLVEFGSANYSDNAFVPVSPYTNYVSETIYYCDDPAVVNSFKVKFDNSWVDTTSFANYANVSGSLTRNYPTYALDPDLNWPPNEDFGARAVKKYNAERQQIDVDMYRVTDRRHVDAIIAAFQRGVPVRYMGETNEYRDPSRLWVAWNLDRIYASGIPTRVRGTAGENHAKIVLLYAQGLSIFGSSNWTSPSATSQQEHNYFTTKSWVFQWFKDQFDRKWNNATGTAETQPFVPLPPDKPTYVSPANGAIDLSRSGVVLKWDGGPWAHAYDIYFGTDPNPPLFAANQNLGPDDPSKSPKQYQTLALPALAGTTYYWKVVSKTMANVTATGPVWSFTTTRTHEGDFDGDAKADIAVFRTSNGTWFVLQSGTRYTTAAGIQWGNGNDVPVPEDYDGDGRTDIAVFRPSNGTWFIQYSDTRTAAGIQWGNANDVPVPADYDGDGKSDIAVFRPSTGTWFIQYSRTGTAAGIQWGYGGDVPVPGDYDGDGRADIAVFRPSTGTWFIQYSRTGTAAGIQWGNGNDVPVPGDYDGDGKTDTAIFRPSTGTWFIEYSGTGTAAAFQWGNGNDVPVPGDYDGDGKTDIAVFRPSDGTWFLWYSRTGTTAGFQWGNGADIPILKRP